MLAPRPNGLRASLLASIALGLFAACGPTAADAARASALTDAGYASLGSGDAAGACSSFGAALELLDPEQAGFERAALGEVEALTELDGDLAAERFLELERLHPALIDVREFETVAHRLDAAGATGPALRVLQAGLAEHPDADRLVALRDQLGARAEQRARLDGEPDSLQALRSMGYVGGKD